MWLWMFLVGCVGAGTASAQAPRVVYVYDDLGRLAEVVDLATGECAVYAYDAVGNVLSITRRNDCAAPPTVGSILPGPGPNSFSVTGTNLLGATILLSDPTLRVTDLQVTGNSLTFRVSSPEPICAITATATITTSFGSFQVPVQVTGIPRLTGDGQPLSGSIAVAGEKDQFCFTLPATERVLVEATGAGGAIFPCLALQTSVGAPVANAQGCFNPIRLDLTLAAGTYFVVVSDFLDDSTGTYNVTLTRFVGGQTLLPEVPIDDAISLLGVIDLYRFTVPATEQVLVEAFRTSGGSSRCLELRTEAGAVVSGPTCDNPVRLDLAVAAGTYFVLVTDSGNDDTGAYRVMLSRFVGGRPLIPDVPMVDTLSPPGDVDLYTFALATSERVMIGAIRTSGVIRPCLDLRTAAGAPVANGRACGDPARLDLTLPAGSYLVALSDEEHNDTGGYNVLLTRFVGARLLVADVPMSDTLSPPGDVDLYTFTLPVSERAMIEVFRTSGTIRPCLDLRTAAGVPVANAQSCGNSTGLDMTLAAGTYFVVVADEFPHDTGGYTVTLTRFSGGRMLDPNVPLTDTISPPGDVDLYTFSLPTARRVIITATRTSGSMTPCLELRTAAGVPVDGGQRCGNPAQVDLTLAAGSYLVAVSDGDHGTGTYSVLLQLP